MNNEIKKIPVTELTEGMQFSAPLFFDDGKNMFLPEKYCITKKHLAILQRWEVAFVVTYGKLCKKEEINLKVQNQDSNVKGSA